MSWRDGMDCVLRGRAAALEYDGRQPAHYGANSRFGTEFARSDAAAADP
jgi:hypothetical protein